jgi:hypothetical protein
VCGGLQERDIGGVGRHGMHEILHKVVVVVVVVVVVELVHVRQLLQQRRFAS